MAELQTARSVWGASQRELQAMQGAPPADMMEGGGAVDDDEEQVVEPVSKKPKPVVGSAKHWVNDVYVRKDKVSSVM
jgi:hypothetical protein